MKFFVYTLVFSVLICGCKRDSPTPASLEKQITSFSFTAASNSMLSADITGTINETNKTISVLLPVGISSISLKASFTASVNATVTVAGLMQFSGSSANNFTSPVVYKVTAADNTYQEYTVTVTTPAIAKAITAFGFQASNNPALSSDIVATINEANKTITATLPGGISLINLKASFTTSANTTVKVAGFTQTSGTSPICFSNPVIYRVNAVDNTYQNYTVTISVTNTTPTIYAAGTESTVYTGSGYPLAKIWKNGVATTLSNDFYDADINDMFVSGNDVYAVGQQKTQTRSVAMLWKNGVAINLSDGTRDTWANAVYVSGNDVYVVGYEQHPTFGLVSTAKLWKNGVAVNLSSGTTNSQAFDVYVAGTDVYVVGYDNNPMVWKNGVPLNYFPNSGNNAQDLNSVYVTGTDVYVAGTEVDPNLPSRSIKLWKNGIATSITDGSKNSSLSSMYVSGTDFYLLGYEYNTASFDFIPKYWKNGVKHDITSGSLRFGTQVYDIFVLGNDVYISGMEKDNSGIQIAKIWKNGVAIELNNAWFRSYAKAVFIK